MYPINSRKTYVIQIPYRVFLKIPCYRTFRNAIPNAINMFSNVLPKHAFSFPHVEGTTPTHHKVDNTLSFAISKVSWPKSDRSNCQEVLESEYVTTVLTVTTSICVRGTRPAWIGSFQSIKIIRRNDIS